MEFRGLPTPGYDETLASWLFRCSVNRHPFMSYHLQLAERPVRWWAGLELKSADPDTDFAAAVNTLKVAGFHANSSILEKGFAFQKGALVDWSYRRFYCPDCLREDVAKGHLPMWRKNWCYEESTACNIHCRRLEELIDPSRYSKAWDAFVQLCNTNAGIAFETNRVVSRLRSTTLIKIAKSISHDGVAQRGTLGSLFGKLFSVFLQAPYKGTHGGAARIHFQTERRGQFAEPKSLEHSFSIGPSTADSSSRFGSMLFAGSLLGIITESRYMVLTRAYEAVNPSSLLPRDLYQAAAFPYLDRRGYGVLHDYLGIMPRSQYPMLERHLQLQEYRYTREGAFDGRPLGIVDAVNHY